MFVFYVTDALHAGMEEAMGLFPKSEYFLIIEEFVEVAPDFLRYFSQTMHLLEDETILSISAWNEHGMLLIFSESDLSLESQKCINSVSNYMM